MSSIFKQALLLIAAGIFIASCSKMPVYQSQWQESPPKSTPDSYRYVHSNSGIKYEVKNDKEYLYVNMAITDRITAMKILRMGMHVYFDAAGEKHKDQYLYYPQKSMRQERSREERPSEGGQTRQSTEAPSYKRMLGRLSPMAEFKHSSGTKEFNCKFDRSEVVVFLDEDTDGNLVYQAAIPLKKLKGTGLQAGDELSIGLITGKMEAPSMSGGGRPGGERPGGGRPGSGRPGGGMRSGSGGNTQAAMQKMQSATQVWFKVKLAEK